VNLSFILYEKVLISFSPIGSPLIESVQKRLQNEQRRIRREGVDYLLFILVDLILAQNIFVMSALGAKIEEIGDVILDTFDSELISRINKYKKDINYLRKNLKPNLTAIQQLVRSDLDFITDDVQVLFTDLQGTAQQQNESIESYEQMLKDQLDIYNTQMNNRLNDIIKFLTFFSVIFIPLTFIAGIYGTNFSYVPELEYRYSYFIMWGVMIVVTLLMLWFFKRKKWF
jgi:magnesium transporter